MDAEFESLDDYAEFRETYVSIVQTSYSISVSCYSLLIYVLETTIPQNTTPCNKFVGRTCDP